METVAKRLYEGMFMIDSAQATADWEGTLSVINTILQRADAEVVTMRKWQERKLTYDIDHKSRATYILCYFKVDGRRISGIEKDVLLSEKVMRALILTTEKRPAQMLERDINGEPEPKPEERPVEATEPRQAAESTSAQAVDEAPSDDTADEAFDEQADSDNTDETAG